MGRRPWVVTGGSGFLGRHLLDRLADRKWEPSPVLPDLFPPPPLYPGGVGGVNASGEAPPYPHRVQGGRRSEDPPVSVVAVGRRRPVGWAGEFVAADLTDAGQVRRVVAEVRPETVIHLAGRTPPGSPAEFEASNVRATENWLAALAEAGRPVRFVLAGSAAELGPIPVEDLPVGEGYPARPVDPYGQSKLRATLATLAAEAPIEAIVARVFNPIGPGLPEAQALGRFARALATGSGPLTLAVGDLRPRRDFIDARDVTDALIALAERGQGTRIYHVGTGRSHSVGEGLERLIALSGREVIVEVDPDRSRSTGPLDSRADIARIVTETSWTPRIAWERSLADLWASVTGVNPPI